jgi:3-methyladenine DNA glycosylase Mpg
VESVGILGPGKLTKYLIIDRELNGEDLTKSKKLWVEDDGLKKSQIHPVKSPHSGVPRGQFNRVESAERIGVSYAGKWAKKKWRFYLE